MNWKFFAIMAAGMMRSAGVQKTLEDTNDTGKDDVIGKGLVYAADVIEWLVSGANGKPPVAPEGLR